VGPVFPRTLFLFFLAAGLKLVESSVGGNVSLRNGGRAGHAIQLFSLKHGNSKKNKESGGAKIPFRERQQDRESRALVTWLAGKCHHRR